MFVVAGLVSLEVAVPAGSAPWNKHPSSLPKCFASVSHCIPDRTPTTHTQCGKMSGVLRMSHSTVCSSLLTSHHLLRAPWQGTVRPTNRTAR